MSKPLFWNGGFFVNWEYGKVFAPCYPEVQIIIN